MPFGTATINGLKYKDINSNGTQDAGEPGLQGFKFDLINTDTNSSNFGKVVQTATSGADGSFQFTNVTADTYKIHEESVTAWTQTQPAGGADQPVTVNLGDSTEPATGAFAFGDTPLSKITVTFTPEAKLQDGSGKDATKAAAMTCTDASNGSAGSNTNSNSLTTSDLQLKQSIVTCTVTFTDP